MLRKAAFEDIQEKHGRSPFAAYSFNQQSFVFKWHYHPEFELTLITEGEGTRLVGDHYEEFRKGDLVLMGPNLPHTWVSSKDRKQSCAASVIQFSHELIEPMIAHVEFRGVVSLLSESRFGLHFYDSHRSIEAEFSKIIKQEGPEKILELLQLLCKLSHANRSELSTHAYHLTKNRINQSRVNKVCQHIDKHLNQEIKLQDMASMVNLSTSAFCKFFKRAIGKTFSEYVNDLRIGKACHHLMETDKSIGEIAHGVGFESISYFNRVFFRKKGMQPREYRTRIFASL